MKKGRTITNTSGPTLSGIKKTIGYYQMNKITVKPTDNILTVIFTMEHFPVTRFEQIAASMSTNFRHSGVGPWGTVKGIAEVNSKDIIHGKIQVVYECKPKNLEDAVSILKLTFFPTFKTIEII